MKITISTPEERALWAANLIVAEQALHDMYLGKSVTSVDTPDDKFTFQVVSPRGLERHILNIRLALGHIKSPRPKARGVVYGGV